MGVCPYCGKEVEKLIEHHKSYRDGRWFIFVNLAITHHTHTMQKNT